MLELPDAQAYDDAVARIDGIDRWCSSTDWVLPLTASMRPDDPIAVRTASGWGLFDRTTASDGRRILMGVDRIWGFACPVIGEPGVWSEIAGFACDGGVDAVIIGGLVEGGNAWNSALAGFDATHRLHRLGGITRRRAHLGDGFDAWFAGRSPRFRQRMRSLRREADHAGLHFVTITSTEPSAVLDRLIAIERRSWKGADDDGLMGAEMAAFYRLVLARLGPDRTRCLVARLDGQDVGYIVGGVRDSTYRGLQLSSAEEVHSLGVGHLLQLAQIERLCDEGLTTYDLGMDMPYKTRWSDHTLETTTIAAFPRSVGPAVSADEG